MTGALVTAPAYLRAAAQRPNILFLMTDDQRFDAMSCAGNQYLRTPAMDRIAGEGVRFEQAFVTNSLCSPSRATIVTGLYSHTHGVMTNGGDTHRLKPGLPTFPGLLREAGYYTALAGKWHIASPPTGFDDWCILPGQGTYSDPAMIANGARVRMRGYVDDVIADQALEMLRNRPKEKPFCMLCQFKAPHRSWEPAERYRKEFEDVVFPEPPTFRTPLDNRPNAIRNSDVQMADMPDFAHLGVNKTMPREERARLNYQHFMKAYYRVLLGVDDNVGRVLDYLDKQKLAENTLVIYTSDNGFFAGEYGLFDKRMMYEPSIRVPLLARCPSRFEPSVDRRHMVLNNDIAHTVLDFAGIARPGSMEGHGMSWRPVVTGSSTPWRDAWMYEYFEYPAVTCTGLMRGIRTDRWKYIHYIQAPQQFELFDLKNDPEERRNLYGDAPHREVAGQLAGRLEKMRQDLGDMRAEDGTPTKPCTQRIADMPYR